MVGGTVIGLARGEADTLLNIQDLMYPGDHCSVRVVEKRIDDGKPVQINVGDAIWWQQGEAMWTPAEVINRGIDTGVGCGKEWDIHLPKVGYSH